MKRGKQAPATSDVKPKKKPGRMGTPPHEPTDELRHQVARLAGCGFSNDEIAIIQDLAEHTLIKYYRKELKAGGLKADAKVIGGLFDLATTPGPEQGKTAIFWAKVRRRWHEVQRVIHGYDPEMIVGFVKQVTALLRRELPRTCPGCKTELHLPEKIAAKLIELSQQMASQLPASEIVPMPRPELASDGLEA